MVGGRGEGVGTVRLKRREFCGEESLLKALSCYCNGRLRNATAHYSDQRTKESERRSKRGREREIGKPECNQANRIMSSELYDLLITKSY